jgi:hypothetical protein
MSDKSKNLLDRIKQLFADTLPTTYKLADGTEVSISLLDVGGDFTIGGVAASEGSYTLEDGTGVMVDSTGKITSVTDPSAFSGTDYTLAGGDVVSIDKMEVGGVVTKGGVAVAEGTWSLEDGTVLTTDANGVITLVTPKAADDTQAGAAMTKEKIQQYADDVAAAAPGDQVGKLVICIKALMEYCFGWQIDNPEEVEDPAEAQQDAQIVQDAINVYKQGLESQFEAKFDAQQLTINAQGEKIKQMLELMTQLAEVPAGDPPAGVQKKHVFTKVDGDNSKLGKLSKYADAAQKLKDQSINN